MRRAVSAAVPLALALLSGCGLGRKALSPGAGGGTQGAEVNTGIEGLEVRAIDPSALQIVHLGGPYGDSQTEFLGIYGSVITHLSVGYRTGEKIAFTTDRDGNYEIYMMNTDGSNPVRLTNNSADDEAPAWSPDGRKIAFTTDRDGNYEIYVMNADGSNPVNLTNNSADDEDPAWSPDGSKIAFVTNRDRNYEIHVMNADGSNPVRLTNNSANDWAPSWSPDGSKIAFITDRDEGMWIYEIYVMNADGSNQTNLTNNSADDWWPAWSPDGRKIAFFGALDDVWSIYVMDLDTGALRNITKGKMTFQFVTHLAILRWSPGGKRIAFGDGKDIYLINSDGTNLRKLTESEGNIKNIFPCWSPDGVKIAFTSNRDGVFHIYTVIPNGTRQERLTSNEMEEIYGIDWRSPLGMGFEMVPLMKTLWGRVKARTLFSRGMP